MKLVKTKLPFEIDTLQGLSAILYFKPCNRTEDDTKMIVTFDVDVMIKTTLVSETTNPVNGEVVSEEREVFKLIKKRKAIYRMTTFDMLFPNGLKRSDYCEKFIEQMEYVNSKEWTGKELQVVKYGNLTSEDVEIVEV